MDNSGWVFGLVPIPRPQWLAQAEVKAFFKRAELLKSSKQ